MDSAEIRGSIEKIYDRFHLPHVLRLHMYRAACVAEIVCDNWKGGAPIEKDDIIAACLLHDIGNAAKFDFGTKRNVRLLENEGKSIAYWKRLQRDTIRRYGRSDNAATHSMMTELKVNRRIVFLVDHMADVLYARKNTDANYPLQICEYADDRVSPYGVMSIRQRVRDFIGRYARSDSTANRERAAMVASKLGRELEVEKALFRHVRISPRQINDRTIKPYLEKYAARGS